MFKKSMLIVFLFLFSVNICGCAVGFLAGGAVAGGAGTAAWISGKLIQETDTSFENTIQATEYALGSLGFDIVKKVKKERVAQIISNYTDGKTIWIDIHKIAQSTSRIEVRVGAIPDKKATRKILDKIKEYLYVGQQSKATTEKKPEVIIEKDLK